MPFSEGNKLGKGGARPNSGRKPNSFISMMQRVFDKTQTEADLEKVFAAWWKSAQEGDQKALAALFDARCRIEAMAGETELRKARFELIKAQTAQVRKQTEMLERAILDLPLFQKFAHQHQSETLGWLLNVPASEINEQSADSDRWQRFMQRYARKYSEVTDRVLADVEEAATGEVREEETDGDE